MILNVCEKMRCAKCNKEIPPFAVRYPYCNHCFNKKEEKMSSELNNLNNDEKAFEWAKKETERLDNLCKPVPSKKDDRIEIIKRLLASRDAQIELIDYLYNAGIMADSDMLDSHKDLNENIVNMFKLVIEAS